ncbi:type II toxin-antitoxin system death-on-curing family toxin [Lacticaseibacillus suilingensis]|uniref:type II toxin-antitoxin system death-on-curing family toxin n=1 Tax=Lacticaseibacillus suilingensis TaxID=2799577 RepID=UPI0022E49FE2|nr:type II toxin-antitoxin system death-on-curing family toxin [Lacticaseibacillus suilingensis]
MKFKDDLYPLPFRGQQIKNLSLNGDEIHFDGFVIYAYQSDEDLHELIAIFGKTYLSKYGHLPTNVRLITRRVPVDSKTQAEVYWLEAKVGDKVEHRFAFWPIATVVPTLENLIEWNARAQEIYPEDGVYGKGGLKADGGRHLNYVLAEVADSFQFGMDYLPTIAKKAAYLWQRIGAAQSFQNGNKRTAMVAMLVFLHVNGYEFMNKPGLKDELVKMSRRVALSMEHTDPEKEDATQEKIDIEDIEKYILQNVELNFDNSPWKVLESMRDTPTNDSK